MKWMFGLVIAFLLVSSNAYGEQIPSWIKNNALWWSQNQITDDEFVKGIQYLIDNKIIKIPDTSHTQNPDSHIPAWIKKTAGWWSSNVLNDSDFIKSVQYLVQTGVITINQNQFALTSPEFGYNETIPVEYTCDGKSVSPPLVISGIPKNTTSLVLIMDDPDATHGTFVHWTEFNILPNATQFTKGDTSSPQGLNGIDKQGYIGPCPPSGSHHYFFKLYALDTKLNFDKSPTKSDLEQAMTGHVIGQTTLLGRYSRG